MAQGTVLITNIAAGNLGSQPAGLTNVNGTLFFDANDGTRGRELWRSNGLASGTSLVKDVHPAKYDSMDYSARPINANGTLFFTADNGVSGPELWRSNGTAPGTVLVRDINPGSAGSDPQCLVEPPPPSSFAPLSVAPAAPTTGTSPASAPNTSVALAEGQSTSRAAAPTAPSAVSFRAHDEAHRALMHLFDGWPGLWTD
jgi:ELWxxDGT repeat protein